MRLRQTLTRAVFTLSLKGEGLRLNAFSLQGEGAEGRMRVSLLFPAPDPSPMVGRRPDNQLARAASDLRRAMKGQDFGLEKSGSRGQGRVKRDEGRRKP